MYTWIFLGTWAVLCAWLAFVSNMNPESMTLSGLIALGVLRLTIWFRRWRGLDH